MQGIIHLEGLTKNYFLGKQVVEVLKGIKSYVTGTVPKLTFALAWRGKKLVMRTWNQGKGLWRACIYVPLVRPEFSVNQQHS